MHVEHRRAHQLADGNKARASVLTVHTTGGNKVLDSHECSLVYSECDGNLCRYINLHKYMEALSESENKCMVTM